MTNGMIRLLPVLFFAFLTGCSLFHRKNQVIENPPGPPPKVDAANTPPPADKTKASEVEKTLALENKKMADSEKKDELNVQLKKIGSLADENLKKPTSSKLDGVPPEMALTWLKHGNTRFVKGYLRKDGQAKKDIQRVALKQKPHAIVFSSSDSRVPPELIFDQKLGEIFVIRNLGGALDNSVVSSIEYAMDHLGVRLLVLLGPAGNPEQKARVQTNLEKIKEALPESSALLKEKLASGEFEVKTAVYDLKTGQVDFE